MNNTLEKAIQHFGIHKQINKAIEEMAELTTELARYQNGVAMNVNIIDEIADVSIVISQLRLIFGQDLVDNRVQEKLHRLESRMTNTSGTQVSKCGAV